MLGVKGIGVGCERGEIPVKSFRPAMLKTRATLTIQQLLEGLVVCQWEGCNVNSCPSILWSRGEKEREHRPTANQVRKCHIQQASL